MVKKDTNLKELKAQVEKATDKATDKAPVKPVAEKVADKAVVKPIAKKAEGVKFYTGTGRRKTAVASVFIYEGKGEFTINGKDTETYFKSEKEGLKWLRPFHLIGVSHPGSQFNGTIKVKGSSTSSQIGAIVHGISRALSEINEEYSKILRKQGLLTRDPRMVERKKPYLRKARKSPQYSKR